MKWQWKDFNTANKVLEFLNLLPRPEAQMCKVVWNEDFKVYTVFFFGYVRD